MKLKYYINSLMKIIKNNSLDVSISLVGSAVISDDFNDIDLLMTVDDVNETKKELMEIFKEYKPEICDDAIKITSLYDKEVSIAVYSKEMVDKIVLDFISGKKINSEHRSWCLGYWIPESFIANLKRMVIVNDPGNYYSNILEKINKKNFYSLDNFLSDVIEELIIKKELLMTANNISRSFYFNDLILAAIRGLKLINNEYLISFKNIEEIIKELNNVDLNMFVSGDYSKIDSIIELLINYYNNKNLYLGTWQFSGDFKKLSDVEIIELIKYAKKSGINRFDTALVYGNGKVEQLLGKILTEKDYILTKIPAKIKPPLENPKALYEYYDYDYIYNSVNSSLKNLNRDIIDTLLLHNWTYGWNIEDELITWLKKIKESGIVNKVGISLPNNYNNILSDQVLENIDVIEAPYNTENKWIESQLDRLKEYGIEIILRSLFMQGKIEDKKQYDMIINKAKQLKTSLVIGMTTKEQIDENTRILKRY